MDVDVADAGAGLDHRHQGLFADGADQAGRPARDEDVHQSLRGHQLIGGLMRRRQEGDGGLRHALGAERLAQHGGQRGVGARGLLATLERGGVAGAQTEARHIHRHVRARLIDARHHAQRHTHAPQVDAAGAVALLQRLPQVVGQVRDGLRAGGHGLDPFGRQQQPVAEGIIRRERGQIRRVGGQDVGHPAPQLRGDAAEQALPRAVGKQPNGARGRLGRGERLAHLSHGGRPRLR